MPTEGYREISRQLSAMGAAVGGQVLRRASLSAMLPTLRAAQANAPRGNPPYLRRGKEFDPYPVRTYKGNLRVPGFTSRNVGRKSWISRDKTKATVLLGVKPEAFYAIQFIELGTSKIPKRPWLEPAFRSTRHAVKVRLGKRLKELIDKAARKR